MRAMKKPFLSRTMSFSFLLIALVVVGGYGCSSSKTAPDGSQLPDEIPQTADAGTDAVPPAAAEDLPPADAPPGAQAAADPLAAPPVPDAAPIDAAPPIEAAGTPP